MATPDPIARARHLVKRAQQNGKPIRVFLGFRCRGAGAHDIVALDNTRGLRVNLPRAEMTVAPDAYFGDVARQLTAIWAELNAQLPAAKAVPPETRMKPRDGHGWRKARPQHASGATP